jgi:MoxR-like ATPase
MPPRRRTIFNGPAAIAPPAPLTPAPSPSEVQDKILAVKKAMNDMLIERDREISAVLAAMVAGEHVLLVGAAGTAKSATLDSLFRCFGDGITKFQYMMTKFSSQEEIFGPVSIADLTNLGAEKYRRLTAGHLPTSHFAFIDEVWKGNGAILNSLLNIMNERIFRQGPDEQKCPLIMMVAASNEYPTNSEDASMLAAAFDRFLFRLTVRPIVRWENKQALWWGGPRRFVPPCMLTLTDVEVARQEVEKMTMPDRWSASAGEVFEQIMRTLPQEPSSVMIESDRRSFKAIKACAAWAFSHGRLTVERDDLEALIHVLWTEPTEQPDKVARVVTSIAHPVGMTVNGFYAQIEDAMSGLKTSDLIKSAGEVRAKLEEIKERIETLADDDDRVTRLKAYFDARWSDVLRAIAGRISFTSGFTGS